MNRATPQMQNFARLLIANEVKKTQSALTKTPVDFSAFEKLRTNLATPMGNSGYHSLLSRALALAQAEVPCLGAVRVRADGTLETVEEHYAQHDPKELFEGRVVLLAQLLGLLVAFIGENSTLRVVREVWPKVLLDGLDFGTEGNKKKRK